MKLIDPELHERLMSMKDEDFCILVTPPAVHIRSSNPDKKEPVPLPKPILPS